MKELTYNSNLDRYSVQLDDTKNGEPRFLIVEGVEMAEAVCDGGNHDELCQDVSLWENLIGDNQNVYYAHTPNENPWL